MLQFLRLFTVQHIFTAAQETYTHNILHQMDRSLFESILHRDLVSQPKGKDLKETIKVAKTPINLSRCILFDDRTKNFIPQRGENGVHVVPFEAEKSSGGMEELREIARWTGIAMLALLVPDVRTVLPYFQSQDHKNRFSETKQGLEEPSS